MMRCTKKVNPLAVLILAFGISLPVAADGFGWRTEQGGTPSSGDGSYFSSRQLSLSFPVHQYRNRGESLSTRAHLSATTFRLDGANALRGEYYWLSAAFDYRQRRGSNAELLIHAEPGIMTDLNATGADAIRMNLEVSGRLYQGQSMYWQLGVMVDRDFGDADPRPRVAFGWKPDSVTEVQVGFPYNRIQARWTREFATYAHVRPAGGIWVEDIDDAGSTSKVSYRNWQAGTGADMHIRGNLWLNGEVGQLFNRRIKASDDTGAAVRATPANSLYWQVGLQLRY